MAVSLIWDLFLEQLEVRLHHITQLQKQLFLGYTRATARELASRNIRVNAIAPGYIDTDMTSGLGDVINLVKSATPMKKFGDTADIAWAAVYLASEEAKFVTGQTISPNGGFVMSQ